MMLLLRMQQGLMNLQTVESLFLVTEPTLQLAVTYVIHQGIDSYG